MEVVDWESSDSTTCTLLIVFMKFETSLFANGTFFRVEQKYDWRIAQQTAQLNNTGIVAFRFRV